MRLDDAAWIKVHGAENAELAIKQALREILQDHSFFDPKLLDHPEFQERLKEVPIPDGIEEAFGEKNLARFDGLLDQYAREVYDWYGDNFPELLDLL